MGRSVISELWRGAASAGVVLFSSFGCSVVVDPSLPSACGADSDCAPGGACVREVCTFGLAPACNSNTECQAAGSEFCVNGQCIANPVNDDCSEIWPQGALTRNTNKLLIGFIGATGPAGQGNDPEAYGTPPLEGLRVALEEIQNSNIGLPGVDGGMRRTLAMLACKEVAGTDQSYPVRMAEYLVKQARVSAIIGASFSGSTVDVWNDFVSTESAALLMSPSSTSPLIGELTRKTAPGTDPEDRLWRTAPSDVVQAKLLRFLARDVRNVLGKPNPTLLTFIKDDPAGNGLIRELETVLDSDFGPAFTEASRYDRVLPEDSPEWAAQANRALRAPYPDVIMALGTNEFVDQILPKIEAGWPQDGTPRPWYVLPEGDRTPTLLDLAAASASGLNERVVGTAPGARRSDYYAQFNDAFETQFFGRSPDNLAEFGYDAAYLLVYAIARTQQEYPSALQLGRALNELNCQDDGAESITPGTEQLDRQFERVSSGACVDFSGASGELDFNADGEAVSDIATWCLRRNSGGFAFEPTLPQYYDAVAEMRREPLDLNAANWCPAVP
jgi:ABC-type branched-subunit amino acid transport system substrate-binding protein